ncbi:MAG: alcohol dehydrogenase catalytic domain-containing protein [Actinobacteria bacterium]|nr:alcohol dehydrogenase catalytic domain-containing protein [Actinomycetota bacterium]
MGETVLAAVRTGPSRTELREYPMPSIPEDCALLRMEVAGICGTDVKMYSKPVIDAPVIMGHENVGVIERGGHQFLERQGLREGDRVFVEHYVGCMRCEWCRKGEYRHCELTDWRTNPDARRYGYTSADNPYHLWGGFAQYMYLPWNAVVHKVPDSVSAELAGLVTPLSNGIEWALRDAGVGYDSSVLIQGPGQQGLSQTVACKQAGASMIIVTGTARDTVRLDMAKRLGADHTVIVDEGDALTQIMDVTAGQGVDVVLDCTSGAGTGPVLLGINALKRRAGTLLIQGELAAFPDFPVKQLTEKAITIKSARGHSFEACELAVAQLASRRFPLELLATHSYGLDEVDHAIRTVGGEGDEGVIHVSLLPWKETGATIRA